VLALMLVCIVNFTRCSHVVKKSTSVRINAQPSLQDRWVDWCLLSHAQFNTRAYNLNMRYPVYSARMTGTVLL